MTDYKVECVYNKVIEGKDNHILAISYNCPRCGQRCQALWMYPEVPMVIVSRCCRELVEFEPLEEFREG